MFRLQLNEESLNTCPYLLKDELLSYNNSDFISYYVTNGYVLTYCQELITNINIYNNGAVVISTETEDEERDINWAINVRVFNEINYG